MLKFLILFYLSLLTGNVPRMHFSSTQHKKLFTEFLDQGKIPLAMITTMKKLKSGYINGTRVSLGHMNDFLSTSCITNLSFLGSAEDGRPDKLNPQVPSERQTFESDLKTRNVFFSDLC